MSPALERVFSMRCRKHSQMKYRVRSQHSRKLLSAPEEPEAPSQPEEETPVPDASKFVIEGGLKTGEGELNETTESGGSVQFSIKLSSKPQSNVTVTITKSTPVGEEEEATLDKTELIFTPENYETPQTVTVTGHSDKLADGDVSFTISLTSSGSYAQDTSSGVTEDCQKRSQLSS